MSEITDNRLENLKVSIHTLRLRIHLLRSFLQKKKELTTNIILKNQIKIKDLEKKFQSKVKKTENYQSNMIIDDNKVTENSKDPPKKNIEEKIKSKSEDGIIKLLPGDCAINQGEEGNSAFLIISGSFNVEIDKKVVGAMSSGEIFGELSLILGENRKATVRAITGSELIEIDSSFLKEYFLSSNISSTKVNKSNLEAQRIIKELSVELGKQKNQKISLTKEELISIFENETQVIKSLAIQLHKRLTQMIKNQKKLNFQ